MSLSASHGLKAYSDGPHCVHGLHVRLTGACRRKDPGGQGEHRGGCVELHGLRVCVSAGHDGQDCRDLP